MDDITISSTSVVEHDLSNAVSLVARPQPLGLFPLPLGFMLIPAQEQADAIREMMLAGQLPASWPQALRAHQLAFEGDREGAIAELQRHSDPVSAYNRFVLDPDSVDAEDLRRQLGEFAILVDVVLFALGRIDSPPPSENADTDVASVVLSAQASHAMSTENHRAAIELLDRATASAAAVSTPLAGTLQGAAGAICRDIGDESYLERLRKALSDLHGADGLRVARAEIELCLAGALHEQADDHPERLAGAIPHYHSALQLVRRDDAPMLWAAAHAGLATAYLTMPMVEASSQLRLGVAAQSLRAALTVYTREDHPQEWASVQLNLAN
jgi:hypothetical protein